MGTTKTGPYNSSRGIDSSSINIIEQIIAGTIVIITILATKLALNTINLVRNIIGCPTGRIKFSISNVACRESSVSEAKCNKH